MDKRAWRAEAKAARRDLRFDSNAYCRTLRRFLSETPLRGPRTLIYMAMPGEVDLQALVDQTPDPTASLAITRTPETGHVLTVHPYGCQTEVHSYGYEQPAPDAPSIPDAEIGAVLVPGLAFDRTGARLGRGKGYYDRLLARLNPGTLCIGITGEYIVDRLPTDEYDIAMTHLATELGVRAVPFVDEDEN